MTIWFTADLHLDHANIILPTFCDRPFSNIQEMNGKLIANLQEVVKPGDDLFILGDFAMRNHASFARRLPGNKYLIFGNHDKPRNKFTHWGFAWAKDVYELRTKTSDGKPLSIWLSHYSHQTWNKSHHGAWHLFGHSHGKVRGMGLSIDVGVDVWDYKPVSLQTLENYFEKYKQREYKKPCKCRCPRDHHTGTIHIYGCRNCDCERFQAESRNND